MNQLKTSAANCAVLLLIAAFVIGPAPAQERRSGGGYRLAKIELKGATVFPVDQLIDQFPIKTGDLINFDKVREGLEKIRKM